MSIPLGASSPRANPSSRIVAQLRERWPQVKIVLRADSGFCREMLMTWCEQNHVDYLFGLQRTQRLRRIIDAQMHQAQHANIRGGSTCSRCRKPVCGVPDFSAGILDAFAPLAGAIVRSQSAIERQVRNRSKLMPVFLKRIR